MCCSIVHCKFVTVHSHTQTHILTHIPTLPPNHTQALHLLSNLHNPSDLQAAHKAVQDAGAHLAAIAQSCAALGGKQYNPKEGIHADVAAHLAIPAPPRPIQVCVGPVCVVGVCGGVFVGMRCV